MSEFIKAALPFFLIGLSLAIFAVNYRKTHRNKDENAENNEWDFSAMGPLFGVAIGVAIGTVNKSIGAGLGAGIGMLVGTLAESAFNNIRNK